jgi:hypothetical protein
MEHIKKKICLEHFISRIPGSIATIDNDDIANNKNGSWGKIPKMIILWGKEIKYQTLMDLYYNVLKVIINSIYYQYDASGKKWIKPEFDWRDTFYTTPLITYHSSMPTESISDKQIIGITPDENLTYFYEKIQQIFEDDYNGFDLVINVNQMIGREIVPYAYKCKNCGHIKYGFNIKKCEKCDKDDFSKKQEMFVPYFLFRKEVPDWIAKLNNLKTDICCERKKYEAYGGDAFLDYLTNLQDDGLTVYDSNSKSQPTIDIPLLITSKIRDLGQYRTYNVDVITEDGSLIEETDKTNIVSGIVKTQGESKLQSLKRRKMSVDDNGVELPFIINIDTVKGVKRYHVELPYKANYVKNLSLSDGILYGDTIFKMKETCTPKEAVESTYLAFISSLTDEEYNEGSISNQITGLSSESVYNTIQYGNKDKNTLNDVEIFFISDAYEKEKQLVTQMKQMLLKSYPKIMCLKQDFLFKYNLIYGVEDVDNTIEDENGNIITTIKECVLEREHSGTIYIVYDNPEIEFTYVLGGRFNEENKKISVSEVNPFELGEALYASWDGEGIWYRETYPIRKKCTSQFLIDNEVREFTYDVIDFGKKSTTYEFHGIDFKRKNYILCEEVCYKSDAYSKHATNDAIFKDEKMLGLNYPLKEDYNVIIERGTSAAFEKHIQLSDIKTWQDLEDYRNGMFLNK